MNQQNPVIFFITAHYRNYPTVLVNLAKVEQKDLNRLLINAWKEIAPKKLLKELKEDNYFDTKCGTVGNNYFEQSHFLTIIL